MQSEDSSPKKISRIRTFQDDISSVRPDPTAKKGTADEIPLMKQKISEQTIFRTPAPNSTPVAKPQIVEVTITEKPITPPTIIEEKIVREVPIKEPVVVAPKPAPVVSEKNSLAETIAKDTLARIATDNISEVISDDTSSEGSVITDQKRTRFSLTSSIVQAMRTWFSDEKESFKDRAETRRKAIPTVRPVEKRKEVLQKAAQQSAMAPRDDHTQLATKFAVPKAKIKQDDNPVQIKKKATPPTPAWSHFTDSQKKLEQKEIIPPTIPVVQQTSTPILTVPPVAEPVVASVPIPPPPKREEIETKPVALATPSVPEVETPKPPAVKLVGNKKKFDFSGLQKFFTYAGIAVVILIAVTSGVGIVWWLFSNSSQSPTVSLTEENVPIVPQELVAYEDNVSAPLPLRKEDLWQAILSTTGRPGSDLVLVSLMNTSNTPATAPEILSTINWPSSSALLRNIEKINFGLYRGTPFMIIKTANFDTAFGGLLSAESTLAEDLNLFITDDMVVVSDDFTDELIQNRDIRVLKNEAGSEVLIYGFVNRNIVIFTSDRDTFSQVADRVR